MYGIIFYYCVRTEFNDQMERVNHWLFIIIDSMDDEQNSLLFLKSLYESIIAVFQDDFINSLVRHSTILAWMGEIAKA